MLARAQTAVIQSGYLRYYLLTILVVGVGLAGFTLLGGAHGPEALAMLLRESIGLEAYFYELALAGLIVIATLSVTLSQSSLGAVAALGIVGYGVALIFLLFGAPDLAMTQFLVESLTVILFVLAFYHLPEFSRFSPTRERAFDAVVALIAGGVMTDRMGRRRLLLGSVAFVLVASALSAAAPGLGTWGLLQVLVNGGTNLAFLVGFIAAVEEAPEGSRTYTIAIVGIAAGLGFVAGAVLLPLADLHPEAWRLLYAVSLGGLAFLPGAAGKLRETRRYQALAARDARRGRVGEVVDRTYRGRFLLLCLTGFLLSAHFAPQSQLLNRYLGDERGFSGAGILLLRAVTQACPALIAAYVGGRLAESRGRRPVAREGLIVGALATAGLFMVGGPLLWVMLAVSTLGQGFAGPALSAFGTELFPTEVRGTAGAGLTVTSVAGSAAGLLVAGFLSAPLGSLGAGIAVTAAGPLIVALALVRHLPEARGRLLDDVSPSEV